MRQTHTLVEVLIVVSLVVSIAGTCNVAPDVIVVTLVSTVAVVCYKLATCCTVSVSILTECVVVVVVDISICVHPNTRVVELSEVDFSTCCSLKYVVSLVNEDSTLTGLVNVSYIQRVGTVSDSE